MLIPIATTRTLRSSTFKLSHISFTHQGRTVISPVLFTRYSREMSTDATNQERPLEVLLVGLGSIGSVYAHILEKVSHTHNDL